MAVAAINSVRTNAFLRLSVLGDECRALSGIRSSM
jgi:hypothetical protein